jgi:putative solute:sodium symporter small subunit
VPGVEGLASKRPLNAAAWRNAGEADMPLVERRRRYWQKNLGITGILLATWFFVTFVVTYFARDLSFTFFGWPFSFWVASQGALLVYVLIVAFYAGYMNKLDRDRSAAGED